MVSITGLVMGNTAYFFGDRLLTIYSSDAEVISMGLVRMKYVCILYFLCGIMDVVVGSLRGMNYAILPMIVSLAGACGLRVLWIFTVFRVHHSLDVLYVSYPITWLITASVHLICFFLVRRRMDRQAAPVGQEKT